MNSFANLFSTFSSFLLFLLLEVLSFVVIIRGNEHQNKVFFTTSNAFSGYIAEKTTNVNHYFSLAKEVERLKTVNAKLMEQRENARLLLSPLDSNATNQDDTLFLQEFHFRPATIVNKSFFGNKNYMTIDKGKRDSIKVNQGVISDDGLVGIVVAVGTHFSRVMTLLHRSTSISAMIKKNQSFGSIVWRGNTPNVVQLEAIPKHIEVDIGDTIVTSGYSNIFPAQLPIGTIRDFKVKKGNSNYEIEVQLFNDLTSLKHVYVIDNLLLDELKNLEKNE